MRKLVGHVSVDSGQVLIVDPAYLREYKDNEFKYETGVRKGSKQYQLWQRIGGKAITWSTPIKAEDGKSMNDLAREGWEVYETYPDERQFSYSGVSTLTSKNKVGELPAVGMGTAVASQSGYGDGNYPVYATMNDEGRVVKLEIDFS